MNNKLIIVAITLFIALCLCACVSTSGSFSYVHDPRLNAEAMKDIVENPDAVYGFSPNPQSKRLGTYAKYDWSDPDVVADAKKQRIQYHQSLQTMYDMLNKMSAEGEPEEKIARTISAERNRLRLATYENDPQGLADVKKKTTRKVWRRLRKATLRLTDMKTALQQTRCLQNTGRGASCFRKHSAQIWEWMPAAAYMTIIIRNTLRWAMSRSRI